MTQGFKNYCRLVDEGFSDDEAFINSQEDPKRTAELMESARERKKAKENTDEDTEDKVDEE